MIACASTDMQAQAPVAAKPAVRKPAPVATPKAVPEPPKPKVFGNDDVLKLQAAGLSEDEIVGAINAAANKSFDTSADALISLKTAGVTKKVMASILNIPYVPDPPPAPPTPVAPAQTIPAGTAANVPAADKKPGGIKSLFSKIPIRVGNNNDEDGEGEEGSPVVTVPRQKLKDGESGIFTSATPASDAVKKIASYLEGTNRRPTVEGATLKLDWTALHKCPGVTMAKCQESTEIRISEKNGGSEVQVAVKERRRNLDSPMVDQGTIKAKLTTEFMAEIETALAR